MTTEKALELSKDAPLSMDITFSNVSISSMLFLAGLLLFVIALVLLFCDVDKAPVLSSVAAVILMITAGLTFLFNIDIDNEKEEITPKQAIGEVKQTQEQKDYITD